MKDLLVFAHLGEAKEFLLNARPFSSNLAHTYEASNYFILICGEGPFKALSATSAFLGENINQVAQVVNYGVAGKINPGANLDQVFSIRTAYAYIGKTSQFQSYTSDDDMADINIVSSDKRVFKESNLTDYLPMSEYIDKEAWGVFKSAKLFKKPVYAFKLVSDIISEQTDCKDIKNKAAAYSKKMFEHYQSDKAWLTAKPERVLPDYFHATNFTLNKWKKLVVNLSDNDFHKFHDLEHLNDILDLKSYPAKQRMNLLLEYLESNLHPEITLAKQKIAKSLEHLHRNNVQTSYDANFEQSYLELKTKITRQTDLDLLLDTLTEFNLKDFQKNFERLDV